MADSGADFRVTQRHAAVFSRPGCTHHRVLREVLGKPPPPDSRFPAEHSRTRPEAESRSGNYQDRPDHPSLRSLSLSLFGGFAWRRPAPASGAFHWTVTAVPPLRPERPRGKNWGINLHKLQPGQRFSSTCGSQPLWGIGVCVCVVSKDPVVRRVVLRTSEDTGFYFVVLRRSFSV